MQEIDTGILFKPFIKDWGKGTECACSTFAAWTKLEADAPDACAAIHRDIDRLGTQEPYCTEYRCDTQRKLH